MSGIDSYAAPDVLKQVEHMDLEQINELLDGLHWDQQLKERQ